MAINGRFSLNPAKTTVYNNALNYIVRPRPHMKLLFDFAPLLVFFVAYYAYDIYVATAASIAAAFIQIAWSWLKHRRLERMSVITLCILVFTGGLTIALHNDVFIKWKPTLVYWVFAVLILGSHYLGKKSAIQYLLDKQLTLPSAVWRRLDMSWGAFFLCLGLLNLYVAFYYAPHLDADTRRTIWVNFKVWGMLGLTFAFTVAQALLLSRHLQAPEKDKP